MQRREFLATASAAAVWPVAARAQQARALFRVGAVAGVPRSRLTWAAFLKRMAELGYREGQDFIFDYVEIPSVDAYDAGFRELMERKPDVIVTSGPEISLGAAIAASETIPIVMLAIDFDPLARGFVASLARPGGRITGLFLRQIELTAKRLQFFKEAFPAMNMATVFWDKISTDQWEAAQRAGAQLGVRFAGFDLGTPPYEYDRALSQAAEDYRKHLFMPSSPSFLTDRRGLAEFALRNRIASMFVFREYVAAGGLISYGPSITGMYSHAADYVDRIARGSKPAELPVEQPTKFELVINLATAKTLELDIPTTLLARADEVIE